MPAQPSVAPAAEKEMDMSVETRPPGPARIVQTIDLRDPEYRRRFIFGDEPKNSRHRATLLGDFLFFGALMRR